MPIKHALFLALWRPNSWILGDFIDRLRTPAMPAGNADTARSERTRDWLKECFKTIVYAVLCAFLKTAVFMRLFARSD